ncbi:hypothetical protein NDU88_001797 [Pleurodeles waltl]|uniref:Uncharacterized protein n=1 Tax=Pleurodeles waltl TaxID=8319 RepID=A0AAV7V9G2_PLEWA|nr:hypothetical protein NDU88_001797 [Pleurodeles waltl]
MHVKFQEAMGQEAAPAAACTGGALLARWTSPRHVGHNLATMDDSDFKYQDAVGQDVARACSGETLLAR